MKYPKLCLFTISIIYAQIIFAQPVISNVTPATGAVLQSGTTIKFSCTVTDLHRVTGVYFIIPGGYDILNAIPLSIWAGYATQSGNVWSASWSMANISAGNYYFIAIAYDSVGNGSSDTVYFSAGNVGIGATNTKGYQLAVNGSAVFTQAVVKPYANWPDYVFQPGYPLPSLDSLSDYIRANGRLPEMPSADSVLRNGLDLGSNQAALLKKIEELTLYIIDHGKILQRRSQQLKEQALQDMAKNRQIKELLNQNTELKTLQERIRKLEEQVRHN